MTTPQTPYSAPGQAPAEVRVDGSSPVSPGLQVIRPAGNGGLVAGAIIGITIGSIAVVLALGYLLLALGAAVFAAAFLALIPLVVVLLGVRWIDRWEPEPLAGKAFAFLWGAGVSVVIALIVGGEVESAIIAAGVDPSSLGVQFFSAAIQAPVVEEGAKGLGVLLIFLVGRRSFDGPVDGIVYAATVAAGFAFTENILYFGSAIADPGSTSADVAFTFFLRAILSPFAHVMFTAFVGIAIGIGAQRFGSRAAGFGLFFVGLIPAMLLHGLWNGVTFFLPDQTSFFVYYAVVQVPLFAAMVGLVLWLRRQESALTLRRLREYAAAGWFNDTEVAAIATPAGRRAARAWAARAGRGEAMRLYLRDSTRLAFARQRIASDHRRAEAQQDEIRLLGAITATRRMLLGGPAPS